MEKLSFDEYVKQLYKLTGNTIVNALKEINNPSDLILEMYNKYLMGTHEVFSARLNGELRNFKTILNLVSNKLVFGSSAEFWFVTSDLNRYLLKNANEFYDRNGSTYNSEVNSVLCPQLAKQFGVDSAFYFIMSYYDTDGQDINVMVTPDFKEDPNEELIPGSSFVKDRVDKNNNHLNIELILQQLELNLKLRRFDSLEITRAKEDFLKQTLFHKLINNSDQNNYNWGILINDRHIRLAPVYDYEYCFFNFKLHRTDRNVGDKSKISITDLIDKYHEKWFIDWIEQLLFSLDFDKACKNAFNDTGYIITDSVKKKYFELFNGNIQELTKAVAPYLDKSIDESDGDEKCS